MRKPEKEIWKWVVGYKGYYKVSNQGRVKSKTRTWVDKSGKLRTNRGRVLKHWGQSGGYPTVGLSKNSKVRIRFVHWLVLEAFIGPRPDGKECRHLNDVKTDNRLENLCWGTSSENHYDMHRNGIRKDTKYSKGEHRYNTVMKKEDVHRIRKLRKLYLAKGRGFWTRRAERLALEYKVCLSTIQKISVKKNWGHV